MKAPLFLAFLLLSACAHRNGSRQPSASLPPPEEFAARRLGSAGIREAFLQRLRTGFRAEQREKVLELNILGFLRARQSGTGKIPGWELGRVRKFLQAHRRSFRKAEREFHVASEVIASLLWVETKHGRDLGSFHVASAYFSLAQADHPQILERLFASAREKAESYGEELEKKIRERARVKAEWAGAELLALQEIDAKGWKDAEALTGSFSGAFGMAQFVPSSYLSWARGAKPAPDLFRARDSILSVANYLRSNGWAPGDRGAQEAALFHYNRDRDYVNHILRMSECLRRPSPARARRTASTLPSC